jgi:hypothetical protein
MSPKDTALLDNIFDMQFNHNFLLLEGASSKGVGALIFLNAEAMNQWYGSFYGKSLGKLLPTPLGLIKPTGNIPFLSAKIGSPWFSRGR